METKISKARLRYLMPEKLIKFLKKEKVLCAFINNMTKRLREVSAADAKNRIYYLTTDYAIMYAFIWLNTPEVFEKYYDFWNDIHHKWLKEFNHE